MHVSVICVLRKAKHDATPRIELANPPYNEETREALEALGPPLALFRLFARRPDRARAIHGWGSYYLSRRSALNLRHRELVIHRTTARCRAEYEWGIHVAVFAQKAELTGDQILSVTQGRPDDACWTDPGDRAVLQAVDALHDASDLSDAEWDALIDAVGQEGAIDLMLVCGWYHAISFVARAARLQPEPGSPAFP